MACMVEAPGMMLLERGHPRRGCKAQHACPDDGTATRPDGAGRLAHVGNPMRRRWENAIFNNAVAVGGPPNAVIHLLALARRVACHCSGCRTGIIGISHIAWSICSRRANIR